MPELCRKNRRSPSPLPPPFQSAHQVSIQHQTSPTFLSWIEMFEIKRSSYSFRRWNLQLCLRCQRKAGKGAFPDHKVKEHLLVCIQTSWGYSADLSGERETKERCCRPESHTSADAKGPACSLPFFLCSSYFTDTWHLHLWWHHITVLQGDENRKLATVGAKVQGGNLLWKSRVPFSLSLHHFLGLLHILLYPSFPSLLKADTSKVLTLTSSNSRSSSWGMFFYHSWNRKSSSSRLRAMAKYVDNFFLLTLQKTTASLLLVLGQYYHKIKM